MKTGAYSFEAAANALAVAADVPALFAGPEARGHWHLPRRAAIFFDDRMIAVESWQESTTPLIEFTVGAPGRPDVVFEADELPSLADVSDLATADVWSA